MDKAEYTGTEAVEKLHSRLFIQTAFIAFLRSFTAISFFSGIIIIILRQLNYFSLAIIPFAIGLAIFIAFSYGITYAFRHDTPKSVCIAAVDAENAAGGLLMAEDELSDISWKYARKSRFSIPDIKRNYSKDTALCLVALAFAVSCCLVPLLKLEKSDRKINLTNKIAEIQDKVELLENQEIITPEEKNQIETELNSIVENSDKSAPGITFEALDQLNEKLCHEAASEMKKRISDNELLKKLEHFAKDAKNSEAAKNGKANELLEQLKNILRQAGMDENQINDFIKQQFGGNSVEQGISQKQINQYADQLGEQSREKIQEAAQLAKDMADKKLIPTELADQLSQEAANGQKGQNQQGGNQNAGMNGKGENGEESNLVAIPQNGQGKGNNDSNGNNDDGGQAGNQPGNGEGKSETAPQGLAIGAGGIGRDMPSNTPLTFGDKASDYNAKFHDETLPETKQESVSDAVSVGIGVSSPKIGNEVTETTAAELKNRSKVGNKPGAQTILPKYRNTVRNYFSE